MRPKMESVMSIGNIVLNVSATAGGMPSPRLTRSFSFSESFMKIVVAASPMMIAPNRPFAPVKFLLNTPETLSEPTLESW